MTKYDILFIVTLNVLIYCLMANLLIDIKIEFFLKRYIFFENMKNVNKSLSFYLIKL